MQIPTIDLGDPLPTLLPSLDSACREFGFFQLIGHGMDLAQLQRVLQQSQAFFHSPDALKHEIRRTADNPWGYFDAELTKNRRDWKEILDIGPPPNKLESQGGPFPAAANQWPRRPTGLREVMTAHSGHCKALADRLLTLIARNLKVPYANLERQFGPAHTSFVRLNYYPTCTNPADEFTNVEAMVPRSGELGISHHTDAGALTVLLQDAVQGLQVRHAGRWITVPTRDDALVINIGDVVQVWSNNEYPAPVHRVLANAHQERFSVAYFFNPNYQATYAPLDSMGAPQYRPINWGDFRAGRAAGDYSDAGEELQISHYKI